MNTWTLLVYVILLGSPPRAIVVTQIDHLHESKCLMLKQQHLDTIAGLQHQKARVSATCRDWLK